MGMKYTEKFCGQDIRKDHLDELIEIIDTFPNISRTELASTICELFSWKRTNGRLKTVECRQFLERLDEKGVINLPANRTQFVKKSGTRIQKTKKSGIKPTISAKLKELLPLRLIKVKDKEQRQLWYEYIDRYHYLGYQLPFGAQLRYFIKSEATGDMLGCFQFSSPAWKMAPRDRWIGWTEAQRKANLQKIINNSRFLIFPWVKVKNLASSALSIAAKTVVSDWQHNYGHRPVLMETLVDRKRFKGTCYKASNWIHMGKTTGRGRMDRDNTRQGSAVKEIYVYPLTSRFRQELAAG
jgi:hypothetical protein